MFVCYVDVLSCDVTECSKSAIHLSSPHYFTLLHNITDFDVGSIAYRVLSSPALLPSDALDVLVNGEVVCPSDHAGAIVSVETGYGGGGFTEDGLGNVGLIGIDESDWIFDGSSYAVQEAVDPLSPSEGVGYEHDG